MPANKRKKFVKMRGSQTHGGGAKKKRRGAGHRGGRGMAGSGKRADQKKPTILKLYGPDYFGKRGFSRPQKVIQKIKTINLDDLEVKLEDYVKDKLVTKEGQYYVVDANKLGYNKILGGGNIKLKLKIKADYFSKKAAEKIKESGGIIESENVVGE
ncbi:uL15 family ribosomal protein [Candidatus Woesearchaeota archaeon]|nr:50S ribosomal protein L15P [uncultured archaeon]MBS3175138.1 uL15 family ribosomal protein [Candidatus Woesearchaeota archaeon]